MARSIQFFILGLCITAVAVMWMPDMWIDALRRPMYRALYTVGIIFFLIILPAFIAVITNEKVRPGERVSKASDAS